MAKPKITYTATNPATGEEHEVKTTRQGINFLVFGYNDWNGKWWVTLSTATDADKAAKAAKSSVGSGYRGPIHPVPATQI